MPDRAQTTPLPAQTRINAGHTTWTRFSAPTELELADQSRPGSAVHRTRSGRAVTRRRGQPGHPERGACGIVTDLTAVGYAAKQ